MSKLLLLDTLCYNSFMTEKTTLELALELGIGKQKIVNKLSYLKRVKGIEYGVIQDGVKRFNVEEQKEIKAMFANELQSEPPSDSTDVNHLLKQIEFLETQLIEEKRANSEMRIMLNKQIDKSDQLQLELTAEKEKGFFARLFGR